jgi:hypothetical protein
MRLFRLPKFKSKSTRLQLFYSKLEKNLKHEDVIVVCKSDLYVVLGGIHHNSSFSSRRSKVVLSTQNGNLKITQPTARSGHLKCSPLIFYENNKINGSFENVNVKELNDCNGLIGKWNTRVDMRNSSVMICMICSSQTISNLNLNKGPTHLLNKPSSYFYLDHSTKLFVFIYMPAGAFLSQNCDTCGNCDTWERACKVLSATFTAKPTKHTLITASLRRIDMSFTPMETGGIRSLRELQPSGFRKNRAEKFFNFKYYNKISGKLMNSFTYIFSTYKF